MVPMLYATGRLLNLLERALIFAYSVGGGSSQALYPETRLWDGKPESPCRFVPGTGGIVQFVVDMAAFSNGDFETWTLATVPDGWTWDDNGGTGTVEQTTVGAEVNGGLSAAKLIGGTAGGTLSRTFTARAGERRRILVSTMGDGSPDSLVVRLINERSGRYFNGTWSGTPVPLTQTPPSPPVYEDFATTYDVEPMNRNARNDTTTLRIQLEVEPGATVFVDDCYDWPGANLVSGHGLVCEDRCVFTWQVGDDGTTFSDAVAAGNVNTGFGADAIPNFFLHRPTINMSRWHSFNLSSGEATNVDPELGELILCQVTEAGRMRDWGMEIRKMEADIANRTPAGAMQVYNLSRWPRHALMMQFAFPETSNGAALTTMREARDDLWGRARGRAHNILIVPDSDGSAVMLTRATEEWAVRKLFNVFGENELLLTELPFEASAL